MHTDHREVVCWVFKVLRRVIGNVIWLNSATLKVDMHHDNLQHWQHTHPFGQDRKRLGEFRTIIVIAITATMMVVEITTGITLWLNGSAGGWPAHGLARRRVDNQRVRLHLRPPPRPILLPNLSFRRFRHTGILRAKGILWFQESPSRHFFQLTGKRFQLEDDRWTGPRCNQLVFISRDFEADVLQQLLQDCLGSVLVSADS